MQFKERHLRIIDNLMSTLRRCKLPEPTGEEMMAFTESFYFLIELKKSAEQSVTQAAASPILPVQAATDETAKLAIVEPAQAEVAPLEASPVKKSKTKKKPEENDQ